MYSFLTALTALILGYLIYGRTVDRTFGPKRSLQTPCYTKRDNVDFLPMKPWRVFLIQFLNIAGTGPIFGAIMGIMFGPAAYLWIVMGCIFGGAVHDYMTGMICVRKGGVSLPEIVGDELGTVMRQFMRILSLVLLVLVGTVFVTTPADILDTMMPDEGFLWSKAFFVTTIFSYFVLATLLPIDKIIGRAYPIFGIALLVMAGGLFIGLFTQPGTIPEITGAFTSHHPTSSMPLFPGICITIACGAVSGFHATQSPLMARCMTNEKYGRPIFYGAMITEGIVALIWAAASIKFADSLDVSGDTPYAKLAAAMINPETGKGSPSVLVNAICSNWMGTLGAILAVLGVVAAPITSGDTAFRSARLILADFIKMPQKRFGQRMLLCSPLFAISIALLFIDFNILWRYFAWTNQTLATFALWAIAVWLVKNRPEKKLGYLVAMIPALFMTMVCVSYILIAPEGFSMDQTLSYCMGGIATIAAASGFYAWKILRDK